MASTAMSRVPRAIFANILQLRLPLPIPTSTPRCLVGVVTARHSSSSKSTPGADVATSLMGSKVTPDVRRNNDLPNEAVFYHPKHNMYVCWHPEVPFPYEMSKPIPMESHATESSLKIQSLVPVREVFRKKNIRLVQRELMQLTYTAQYGWRGIHGRKIKWVRKDLDPLKQKRNREYL